MKLRYPRLIIKIFLCWVIRIFMANVRIGYLKFWLSSRFFESTNHFLCSVRIKIRTKELCSRHFIFLKDKIGGKRWWRRIQPNFLTQRHSYSLLEWIIDSNISLEIKNKKKNENGENGPKNTVVTMTLVKKEWKRGVQFGRQKFFVLLFDNILACNC